MLLLISIACISCKTNTSDEVVLKGKTMGTTYTVKYINKITNPNKERIQNKIDSVLVLVNEEMSTYIPSSEISKFNSFHDTTWFNVSEDFVIVLRQAEYIADVSGGYFDPTIEPLVNLWGFGPEKRERKLPSKNEIDSAKKLVNFALIETRLSPPAIKKRKNNIYLDLSSIAKGYGVDKVSDFLEEKGIESYLVEIGGELKAHGRKADSTLWKVGVINPNEQGLSISIKMNDLAIATSGDYLNYFEYKGKRYSHTINPKTGKPVTHNLASVSVIDPSCMTADGYATAIDVLGDAKGFELAERLNIPVYMILRDSGKYKVKMNEQFRNLIRSKK